MWKRIGLWIRGGEDVDLYLVLAVSVAATGAAILGLGSDRFILGLTTTAIGLMGLSFLQQRASVTAAILRLDQTVHGARFQAEAPYDLPTVLSSSKIVLLAGVDLARTFSNYEAALRNYLASGRKLRIMLYHPESAALEYAVYRSKRPFTADRQANMIRSAFEDFSQLKDIPEADLEIRLSKYPFPQGVVASDYLSNNGYICLKHYAFKAQSYDLPWFRLTPTDGKWYRQWGEELEALWEQSSIST